MKGILSEGTPHVRTFAPYLLGTLDRLVDLHSMTVLPLVVELCRKLNEDHTAVLKRFPLQTSKLISFILSTLEAAVRHLKIKIIEGDESEDTFGTDPALLWVALECYPFAVAHGETHGQLAWEYAFSLDKFLNSADHHEPSFLKILRSLLGAALSAHAKVLNGASSEDLLPVRSSYIELAHRHRESPHVLGAVVNLLESTEVRGHMSSSLPVPKPVELNRQAALEALKVFHVNLSSAYKYLRVVTLRLLCHFQSLEQGETGNDCRELPGQPEVRDLQEQPKIWCQSIQQLLAIESAPSCLGTSRQGVSLLSHIRVDVCSGKVPLPYVVPLVHAMVGVMHNRFSPLWDAASEILAALVEAHGSVAWEIFMQQLKGKVDLFLWDKEDVGPKEPQQDFKEDIWSSFNAYVSPCMEYTNGGSLLLLLVKTLQHVPAVVERHSRELVPLFLVFVGHEEGNDKEVLLPTVVGGKEWRAVLREWLVVLKEVRNARSLFRGPLLKRVLTQRFLADRDPAIQQLVLECLFNWKDSFLTPYRDHLVNLISYKGLREELTTWNVGRDGQQVLDEHREGLIPIFLQVLFPKLMKRGAKVPGKAAAGVQRSAILGFLSHLDTHEMAPFFCQILRPLQGAFLTGGDTGEKWIWEAAVGQRTMEEFVSRIDGDKVSRLPYKRKLGFLHMIQDVLGAFDRVRLGPYLAPLLSMVFKFIATSLPEADNVETTMNGMIMDQSGNQGPGISVSDEMKTAIEGSAGVNPEPDEQGIEVNDGHCAEEACGDMLEGNASIHSVEGASDFDGFGACSSNRVSIPSGKEIRHACCTILAAVLTKFEDTGVPQDLWNIFLRMVTFSMRRFKNGEGSLTLSTALSECLLALSKRRDLVWLLARDVALIPSVLSMLSASGSSSPSIVFVLSFVQNILEVEMDSMGEDDMHSVGLIHPHLNQLLLGLGDVLLHHTGRTKGLKNGFILERVLQILISCSRFVKEKGVAARLVDVLLSLLKGKQRIPVEERFKLLHVIDALSSKLDSKTAKRCVLALAPLLVVEARTDMQTALCHIFHGLATVLPNLSLTVRLMDDLMAMSTHGIDEIDFARRLGAYGQLDEAVFSRMSWLEALLILSISVRDIGSEDISLRHSSSSCLKSFIRFAASLPDHVEVIELDGESRVQQASSIASSASPAHEVDESMWIDSVHSGGAGSLKSLVKSFLLPNARTAMNSDRVGARREWVSLLREMIIAFPSIPSFQECQHLTSNDAEVDFFYNIVHLQVHRRIRAMARFRSALASHNLSQGLLVRIFVPLFRSSLFEARADKEGNLVGAAIETIAFIAAQLPWYPYSGLLNQCFRLVSTRPEHEKTLTRLISSILDQFHFFTYDTQDSGNEPETSFTVASEDKLGGRLLLPEVSRVLQMSVLPEAQKLMMLQEGRVNASLAAAVAKILKFLPEHIMEIELPPIVQNIVNLLKHRRQAVRDEARAALVVVSKALGAQFLHFVVNIMQSSLTRGYELHVLGYTVNSILLKVLPEYRIGEIDYCLDQLLGSLFSTFLGEVAEEKDVEGIARKMKETKRVQYLESMQLLAKSVTFRSHAMFLLKPIIRQLESVPSPKDKVKLQLILRALATGIQGNTSVEQEDFFVFIQELLAQGLQDSSGQSGTDFSLNYHLLMEFALDVLHANLRSLKVSPEHQQVLSMLGPLLDLLRSCLKSKYDAVICGALKCLSPYLKFPTPNLRSSGAQLTSEVLSIVQRFGSSESDVSKASFTLLDALVRRHDISDISKEQLHTLLDLPIFFDLEGRACITALNLLKAVIGRKLLVPELYDLVKKVEQVMIRSQVEAERKLASQVLLQFLLDYPLGPRRLQQHLDFFITNIGYEETSGREAALEMVHTVISKFPGHVVEHQAESMFLALVTRLANDEENHVRAMAGTVLKALMWRVDDRIMERMFDFAMSWYQGSNGLLWRPAAQVLGYVIEVMGNNFGKHVGKLLPSITAFLKHAKKLQPMDDMMEGSEGEQAPLWQETYLSVVLVEKLLQNNEHLCLHESSQGVWELLPSFLLHQHTWVRKASTRLLGMYFTACGLLKKSQLVEKVLLAREGCLTYLPRLIQLASAFTQQLDSVALDEDMGQLVVQNLVFVTCLLVALPQGVTSGKEELCQDESVPTGDQEDGNRPDASMGDTGYGSADAVQMIFRRVAKTALRIHPVQTKACLRWFSSIASRLGASVETYLSCMLEPLYKINAGYTPRPVNDDLRLLGEQVVSTLREVVGSHFEPAFSAARERVNGRRVARKEADKTYVLRKPGASAKRKLRLTSKRHAQKRRKILESKVERGL